MSDYFFNLNSEGRIGFKKLTKTDLGLDNNHVTHIGLLSNVLSFLPDDNVVKSGMLIYEDKCEILDFYFDRIFRENGVYNSPKIRSGKDRNNSIVVKIREISSSDPDSNWFLIWFGLESDEVVFWLVKEGSRDYNYAKTFFYKDKVILTRDLKIFKDLETYLLNRINFNSIEVQKDIEVKSLIGDEKRLYKPKDLENAEKRFREVGKYGEELIDEYLEKEKRENRISSFVWVNKSKETGLPYDFIINDKKFVDVKSTRFDFDQYLFYSDNEIKFAASKNIMDYSVFRVFNLEQEEKMMRICNNCLNYMKTIYTPIKNIQEEMVAHKTMLQTLKVGVKPFDCFVNINNVIIL